MLKMAFIFPGQGSQTLGMLSAYNKHPILMDAIQEASEAIAVDLEYIIENDNDALNQTINTQPCMLAMGVGVYRLLQEKIVPSVLAGHSLGEYSALVCAQCLSLKDATKLVRQRAQLMHSAVDNGGMAAILGLDADTIDAVCSKARESGELVWAANYNTEKQTVIAGTKNSIEKLIEPLLAKGAKKVVILAMSVPSHCPLLQEAADRLQELMSTIHFTQPKQLVLHTSQYKKTDEPFPKNLINTMADQLISPVNWLNILQQLKAAHIERVVEVGPGKILTGLGKASGIDHIALNNADAVAAIINH